MFSVDLKCRQCLKNVLIAMCLLTKGYAGQFPTCLYKYSLYEYVLICGIAKKRVKKTCVYCLVSNVRCLNDKMIQQILNLSCTLETAQLSAFRRSYLNNIRIVDPQL